ncbi:D-alanyl-D-alanine dipeptidase [Pseudomonas citronellolis]|nr:D-alanyl-D-alanine dipeptidase [Pseudomonas citronellolis]MCP1657817.1 D-alanyl-D-alanine dipeptidase [Pseudomonas citronellolis]MCP1724813.1 D-alanyl-D-alanine dipeptidase [Pseudomonas citronellolis]
MKPTGSIARALDTFLHSLGRQQPFKIILLYQALESRALTAVTKSWWHHGLLTISLHRPYPPLTP